MQINITLLSHIMNGGTGDLVVEHLTLLNTARDRLLLYLLAAVEPGIPRLLLVREKQVAGGSARMK